MLRSVNIAALLAIALPGPALAAGNGIDCTQIRETQAESALGLRPGTLSDVFTGPNQTLNASNIGEINRLIRQDRIIQGIAEQNGLQINSISQVLQAAKVVAPGSTLAGVSTGQAMQALISACGGGSRR
jgi:hypothetical protein